MKTLSERVLAAMAHARINQVQLAERIGKAAPSVNNWVTGKTQSLKADTAIAAAQVMGVSVDWLANGKGQMLTNSDEIRESLAEYQVAPALHKIPLYSSRAAMGTGFDLQDHVDVVKMIGVSLEGLRKQARFTKPNNLAFITGFGDSMRPTYEDGDVLLIDRGVNNCDVDGIYAFTWNQKFFIKTLQRRANDRILIISDNKKYEPELLPDGDELMIEGRIILAWNARRL